MSDPNWFQKKWGKLDDTPVDDIYDRLSNLEVLVKDLELRIEELQRENVETSNCLYEIMNTTEAIDRRIDIVFEEFTK
jgi:hypothetical protein